MDTIYNIEAELPSGKTVRLDEYKWKVLLIVNTASKCWLTHQYEWLESLYQKYKEHGLVVLGFPCNQFANQEPGTDEEIKQNCLINYGVSFPIFKKIEVNWPGEHKLFTYLKKHSFSWFSSKIKWNFTKFLVSKDGKTIKRYAPLIKPESLEATILELLNK